MRFSVLIVFALFWSILVYNPLCHWVWGVDGWMRTLGILDFAGGTVVHISSGISGLVAAIIIGRRKGYKSIPMPPHNIPYVLLGTSLLWFGWFGFNAGSSLGINEITLLSFLNTNTAAAAAVLSWILVEWIRNKKATIVGSCTGAIVGLVAITPAAGFVTPLSALLIGALASPVCYLAINYIKEKFGYDDSLDAFGCHGIGGIFGALATGVFATTSINPAGADGALYGNLQQLLIQAVGVLATVAFCIIMTYVILKVISLFKSLRIETHAEETGLDSKYHGEEAYSNISA
jgi:Amt family ammonium transporter